MYKHTRTQTHKDTHNTPHTHYHTYRQSRIYLFVCLLVYLCICPHAKALRMYYPTEIHIHVISYIILSIFKCMLTNVLNGDRCFIDNSTILLLICKNGLHTLTVHTHAYI